MPLCHALVMSSKPTSKREPCKLNKKEKETSSKIVVWCVRCLPTYGLAGAPPRRPAQSPFRNPTTPHTPPYHRYSYTTPTSAGKQASQAKPSRTRNTRSTKQLHKAVDNSRPLPPRAASPILHQWLSPTTISPNNTFKRMHRY